MGDDKDNILTDFTSMYWPSLARECVISPGVHCTGCRVSRLYVFVSQDSKDPLIYTMPVTVFTRDPYLGYGGTMVARQYS